MFDFFKTKNEKSEEIISLEKENKRLADRIIDEKNEARREVEKVTHQFGLAMKEKEFELLHFKDEKVKELEKDINDKDIKIAKLTEKTEMLDKIVELNGDIVDIKTLISTLINKLPEIKISSMNFNGEQKNG